MPIIRIDYDNNIVKENEINDLVLIIDKIVTETTKIDEVLVYADFSHITLKISPIEIFIEMSANRISDRKKLVGEIKERLKTW